MLRLVGGLVVSVFFFSFFFCRAGALSHCEITEIPKSLLRDNVISIVYTMESSCKVCVQQASRLPQLKRYLEKKGIKTNVIIGVSHSADRLSGLVPSIQVNSRHVWRALGKQNNHFYVIDRCGRMVFEIINPWSNLNFPFVRSSVVAVKHTHPCGLCPTDYSHIPKQEEIVEYPEHKESSEFIPEDVTPLKVVVNVRHRHRHDPKIYNHLVKIVDEPKYHGHLPNDGHLPIHQDGTVHHAHPGHQPNHRDGTAHHRHQGGHHHIHRHGTEHHTHKEHQPTHIYGTAHQEHNNGHLSMLRGGALNDGEGLLGNGGRASTEVVNLNNVEQIVDKSEKNTASVHATTQKDEFTLISKDTKDSSIIDNESTTSKLLTESKLNLNDNPPGVMGASNSDKRFNGGEQLKSQQNEQDMISEERQEAYKNPPPLTENEQAERNNLINYYKPILNWIHFSDDYDDGYSDPSIE